MTFLSLRVFSEKGPALGHPVNIILHLFSQWCIAMQYERLLCNIVTLPVQVLGVARWELNLTETTNCKTLYYIFRVHVVYIYDRKVTGELPPLPCFLYFTVQGAVYRSTGVLICTQVQECRSTGVQQQACCDCVLTRKPEPFDLLSVLLHVYHQRHYHVAAKREHVQ